jgi:hypothetical protein
MSGGILPGHSRGGISPDPEGRRYAQISVAISAPARPPARSCASLGPIRKVSATKRRLPGRSGTVCQGGSS